MQKIEIQPIGKPSNGIELQHKIIQEEKHTEEMQEIITKVPSWILRWGIMLFWGILLIAAGISVLVRYPDIVKANLKIISSNPSKTVIATTNGLLTKIFVRSGSEVSRGQKLAYVQSISNPAEGYFLKSTQDGTVAFISIIQQGSSISPGQELFRINSLIEHFYGVTAISQSNINKVNVGQTVHINILGYPVDKYGQITGSVSFIADEPDKTGVYMVKVLFGKNNKLRLKEWMVGNAEIITEDVSLQARVYKTILKGLR